MLSVQAFCQSDVMHPHFALNIFSFYFSLPCFVFFRIHSGLYMVFKTKLIYNHKTEKDNVQTLK